MVLEIFFMDTAEFKLFDGIKIRIYTIYVISISWELRVHGIRLKGLIFQSQIFTYWFEITNSKRWILENDYKLSISDQPLIQNTFGKSKVILV